MNTAVDLLQIKIEKAKSELPKETREAIEAVDWKTTVLKMRAEKGYSYTQLEDLEIETELLLCGLLTPEQYPKELEKRMGMPKAQIDLLVNEMNQKIFQRIREELVKNISRKKLPLNNQDEHPLETREEMLKTIENPPAHNAFSIANTGGDILTQKELPAPTSSILDQKLSGSFQIPAIETEHSLTNVTKSSEIEKSSLPKVDPYREIPE